MGWIKTGYVSILSFQDAKMNMRKLRLRWICLSNETDWVLFHSATTRVNDFLPLDSGSGHIFCFRDRSCLSQSNSILLVSDPILEWTFWHDIRIAGREIELELGREQKL